MREIFEDFAVEIPKYVSERPELAPEIMKRPLAMRVNGEHLLLFLALITTTLVLVNAPPSGLSALRPRHLGDSILVHAGQMVIGNPDSAISDPVDVDIGRFVTTSRLITDFPPLPSEKSILAESQKQQREKSKKTLIDTNLVIFGGGTQVSLVDQGQTDTTNHSAAAPVTPHRASNLSPQAPPGPQ